MSDNKIGTSGWGDNFVSVVGEFSTVRCRVCGVDMVARRAITGPHGMTIHDEFSCSSYLEKWHEQAKAIMRLAEECPSDELSKIMLAEADRIIHNKWITKVPNTKGGDWPRPEYTVKWVGD